MGLWPAYLLLDHGWHLLPHHPHLPHGSSHLTHLGHRLSHRLHRHGLPDGLHGPADGLTAHGALRRPTVAAHGRIHRLGDGLPHFMVSMCPAPKHHLPERPARCRARPGRRSQPERTCRASFSPPHIRRQAVSPSESKAIALSSRAGGARLDFTPIMMRPEALTTRRRWASGTSTSNFWQVCGAALEHLGLKRHSCVS